MEGSRLFFVYWVIDCRGGKFWVCRDVWFLVKLLGYFEIWRVFFKFVKSLFFVFYLLCGFYFWDL